MPQVITPTPPLTKSDLKEAFIEAIRDQRELFGEIMLEVLEDIALGKLIEEGVAEGRATEDEVMKVLHGEP